MANARIEYLRPLFGVADKGHAIEALISVVDWFAVADTATAAASRPIVPAAASIALVHADAPIFVAWGDDPTAAAAAGVLVYPGQGGRMLAVQSGQKLSFINAPAGLALAVGGAQITTKTATISSGGSLSAAVDLGTGRLVGIIMPSGWTAAGLSFEANADGGSTTGVLKDNGTERTITIGASEFSALQLSDWLGVRGIKLRSGTSGAAVNQGADRIITLVLAN